VCWEPGFEWLLIFEEPENRGAGESGSRRAGEWERWRVPNGCRCEALQGAIATKQSEAIHNGDWLLLNSQPTDVR